MKNIQYGTEFLDQLKDRVHDLYDENVKLKEEIERLKEEYIMLQNASDEVEEEKDKEIEILQDMDKILRNENINLKLRINKAIEYIEENTDNTNFLEVPSKELLEILDKGE